MFDENAISFYARAKNYGEVVKLIQDEIAYGRAFLDMDGSRINPLDLEFHPDGSFIRLAVKREVE